MFFKFPYTDLYSLNLDWMIKYLEETKASLEEWQEIVDGLGSIVHSVNGQTGTVQLGTLVNSVNGQTGTVQLGTLVNSVNGKTGAVAIDNDDINELEIEVVLQTTDAAETFTPAVVRPLFSSGIRFIIINDKEFYSISEDGSMTRFDPLKDQNISKELSQAPASQAEIEALYNQGIRFIRYPVVDVIRNYALEKVGSVIVAYDLNGTNGANIFNEIDVGYTIADYSTAALQDMYNKGQRILFQDEADGIRKFYALLGNEVDGYTGNIEYNPLSDLINNIDPVLTSNPPFFTLFTKDHNNNYDCYFDIKDYKNSTKQYFVDPVNGNDSNSGMYQLPLKTVSAAYAKEDVTEIVLFPGIYTMNDWFGSGNQLTKTISISTFMGGNVKFICGVKGNFTSYNAENNIYRMYTTACGGVIDLNNIAENGNYYRFTLASSLETITNGQYFIDADNYVYIKSDTALTERNLYILKNDRFGITFKPTNGGILTAENIEFIGGACAVDIRCLDATGTNKTYGYFDNCKFTNAVQSLMWETSNGLNSLSAETFCKNCIAAYNYDDGFCYHKFNNISSTLAPVAGEYQCKGHDNGVQSGTDNGSTIHDGGRAIRVNCEYFKNIGPNVADVHEGTVSWNYNVFSHDALSGANFTVSQESARMILVDCKAENAETALQVGTNGTTNVAYLLRPHLTGNLVKADSSSVVFR